MVVNSNTDFNSRPVDFTAVYPDFKIKMRNKYLILCLSNPIGWAAGILYAIAKIFQAIVVWAGSDKIYGTSKERAERNYLNQHYLKQLGANDIKLQTPDGRKLEGMLIRSVQKEESEKNINKTVILFTGSHNSFEKDALAMATAYQKRGYNVICLNYGGFGLSEGSITTSTLENDALTAYQYAQSLGLGSHLCVHGYSLGSYPASYLAKHYTFKKVVLDRGFKSMSTVVHDVAKERYCICVAKILKLLAALTCNLNNLDNLKDTSPANEVLFTRADYDNTMKQSHMDVIKRECPRVKTLDVPGNHKHSSDNVWFQDHEIFWEWMNR